jgi:phosphoserine aminotransferase
MSEPIYNFSAGPAMMPPEVLETARRELVSFEGIGMSVMEISHRSGTFARVLERAESGIRRLLAVPENYRVLFLQGGASLQFAMVPLNFLANRADYVVTGAWGKKALREARKRGEANVVVTTEEEGFTSVPAEGEIRLSADADYVHYCSNETIDGVEFKYDLDAGQIPVVCDASSNILSKPIDIGKYALIYAGAQKNIGPSGVTLVIIRDDMLAKVPENQFSMLDYRAIATQGSMLNTPNTWGIYLVSLVCDWLEQQGGVAGIAARNKKKAGILYEMIDSSDGFYRGHADPAARSLMNVTFRLPTAELEDRFVAEATAARFNGLKGHRSVGGIRASIYNAFPQEGVERLVDLMKKFAERN